MYNIEKVRLSNSDIQSIPKKLLQIAILDVLIKKHAVIDGSHASHTSHLSIPIIAAKSAQKASQRSSMDN